MNKTTKIIIAAIVIIALVLAVVVAVLNSKPKTNLDPITSGEDLAALISKIYEGQEENLPATLQTNVIDVTDETMVQSFTGLENGNDLEYLAVSEPMMTSQAYSLVLAKVKSGVDANKIAETMKEKVDTRKWICVSAEQLYVTNSSDVVCLVMTEKNTAKTVFDKFKELAGTVGEVYEKAEEEIELPPDMY